MYMIVWGKSWVFLGIPRHPPSSAHGARGENAGKKKERRKKYGSRVGSLNRKLWRAGGGEILEGLLKWQFI